MKKVIVFISSGLMVFASLSATECMALDQKDQHQRPRPNRRDRIENKRDRREDIRDKREDVRDRREDVRDRRENRRDRRRR
jgi:hypothetical protein